jgi:hypothetical protein
MILKQSSKWEFTDKRLPVALRFSADGSTLLISREGVLQIVDVATGEAVARKHSRAELPCAAVSHDGARLAYGGEKRLLVVASTGKTLVEHKIPIKQRVTSVQWTRGGQLLVTLERALQNGRNELLLLDSDGAIMRRGDLVDDQPASAARLGEVVHVASSDGLRAYAFDGKDTFAPGTSRAMNAVTLFEAKQGTVVHSYAEEHHHFGLLDVKLGVKPFFKIAYRVLEGPVASFDDGERFAIHVTRELVVFSKRGKPQRCPSPIDYPDHIAVSKTHLALCDFKTILVFEFQTPLF